MTLRDTLGGEARRVHEAVDELLDREDGVLVLIDGNRAISYAAGFGLSACQLELLAIEIERAVRSVAGTTPRNTSRGARREIDAGGSGARGLRPVNGDGVRQDRRVAHGRGQSVGAGDAVRGDNGIVGGSVLRLARPAADVEVDVTATTSPR